MPKKLHLTIVAAAIILGSCLPALACGPHEGLSPGYWKNHPEAWPPALYPSRPFAWDFGVPYDETMPYATLMDALNAKGGGANALARQAAAALLNAADLDINYPLGWNGVVTIVKSALSSGNACEIESVKNELDCYNNLGCCF